MSMCLSLGLWCLFKTMSCYLQSRRTQPYGSAFSALQSPGYVFATAIALYDSNAASDVAKRRLCGKLLGL